MRGLLYCGGGHTTMVHSTPAQDTAVFATPSVCGAVPAKTPSAGFGFPSRSALFPNAARVLGLTKRRGPHQRVFPKAPFFFFRTGFASRDDLFACPRASGGF